jgi:non-specific serine/threonine protein kinase
MAWLQGDHEAARHWLEEAISAARESGNRHVLAYGLIHLGFVPGGQDEARSTRMVEDGLALARELGDPWWAALALLGSGTVALGRGDRAAAHTRLEESLMLWRRIGDAWFLGQALNALGDLARSESEHHRAAELYSQSLTLLREHGLTTNVASVLHNLGYVSHHEGDDRRAVVQFLESLDIFVDHGDHRGVAECLIGVGVAMLGLRQLDHAVRLLGAGEALLVSMGSTVRPTNLSDLQRARATARTQSNATTYDQNWSEGQAMGPEEAIAYARRLAGDHPASGGVVADTLDARQANDTLTPREREIALLLARGFSNHQIAEELVITERTVETHVKRILGKLGIHSRHQVADVAVRAGLSPAPTP